MNRAARFLTGATILLMAGAALAQPGGGKRKSGGVSGGYADPSGVIAAEIALGQLSVEKGEAEALAKLAAKDAVLFVPDPVFAQRWLKGRKGPLRSTRWGTETVYMSCDGRVAVATGHYTPSDGKGGTYDTLWRRDPKAGFQWIVSVRAPDGSTPAARDADAGIEIDARVAFCKKRSPRPDGEKAQAPDETRPALDPRQLLPTAWEDRSDDGSLRWRWAVAADKSRTLDVWMATDGGGERQVVHSVSPPAAP